MFGVGLELCPGELTVDALTPGCSAEKSGSVVAGDEIIAVDGAENLTVQHAKQLMMGRQGSYATVTFRRQEANAMRSFKVQLMRGAADYIFLVEALRSLETQNARLTKENERLRANQGDPNQTRNDQERIRELLESNEELYGQIKSYKVWFSGPGVPSHDFRVQGFGKGFSGAQRSGLRSVQNAQGVMSLPGGFCALEFPIGP
jgi:hypothetical protein